MKTIFTILALFCVHGAFAQNVTDLRTDDLALTAATGRIVSSRAICPKIPGQMSCMAMGSIVEVAVDLNGCLDHLGGHFEKVVVVNGKGMIYFSAVNVVNEGSKTARCFARPYEIVQISTPFSGPFELVNLDYNPAQN
jgi:hypothetical protein